MIELLNNIWAVYLETAFWLLIGLLAAGIIKTYIPESAMRRWVGGKGFGAVSRAALFGAPLPLCSCGVLPAAIGLHRAGASKEATVSFLISTPETSIDSVAVTYALMGPVMAIYRPIAALMSAMITGMLTSLIKDEPAQENTAVTSSSNQAELNSDAAAAEGTDATSAASGFNANETIVDKNIDVGFNANETLVEDKPSAGFNANSTLVDKKKDNDFDASSTTVDSSNVKSCCSSKKEDVVTETVKSDCCSTEESAAPSNSDVTVQHSRWFQSIKYASADLLDDISGWMAIGIVLAGVMMTFIPMGWLAEWGSGLSAMLIMLVVGIPLYICAVASTPVAAGLLLAGVSPGAVLVFLLVGPATNIASFALVKRELGLKVTIVYLLGISVVSVAMGLLLEFLLATQNWQIEVSLGHAHSMLPAPLAWGSAILLLLLAIKPLRTAVLPQLG